MAAPQSRLRGSALVIASLAPMLAVALTRDLWAPDEPRYAEVALECWTRGDFIDLRLCGEPYPDKPPLAFLLAALAGALGGFHAVALRIPTVLASLITAACIVRLARRHMESGGALVAVTLHLSTVLVFHLGGRLQIDPLLTMFVTAAITAAETSDRVWPIGLLTGLGALAKGPVAWLFVGVWCALRRGLVVERNHSRRLEVAAAVSLAILPVTTWAVLASAREPEVASALFFEQHLGRILTARSHPGPFFEPLLELLAFSLPWTPLFVAGSALAFRERRTDFTRRCAMFVVVALAFFSLVADKRELYLLPAQPFLALLGAKAVLSDARRALRASLALVLLCALGLIAAPLLRSQVERAAPGVQIPLELLPWIGAAGAACTWMLFCAHAACGTRVTAIRTAALFATLVALVAIVVLPPLDPLKSSRAAAIALAERRERPQTMPCVGVRPEAYRFFAKLPTVADQDTRLIGPALDRDGADFLALVWTRDIPRLPAGVRDRTRVLASFRVGSRDILLLGLDPGPFDKR